MSETNRPSPKRYLVCIVTGIVTMLSYVCLRSLIFEGWLELSLYPLVLVVAYGALVGIMLAFFLQGRS